MRLPHSFPRWALNPGRRDSASLNRESQYGRAGGAPGAGVIPALDEPWFEGGTGAGANADTGAGADTGKACCMRCT